MKFFLTSITILFVFFFVSLNTVHAAGVTISGATPQGSCGPNAVDTALGCISTNVTPDSKGDSFFGKVIQIAVGLGGALALVLMLYGVFIVTTSAGMPDKLKAGQEIITSAISGLIFIILSVFLLNLIGINILGIPGLS